MNAAIKVACYIYDVQVYSPWLYKYSNYFSSRIKTIYKIRLDDILFYNIKIIIYVHRISSL